MIDFVNNLSGILPQEGPACQLSAEDIRRGQEHAARIAYVLGVWLPEMEKFMKKAKAFKKAAISGKGKAAIALPPCPVFSDLPPPLPPGSLSVLTNLVSRMKLADNDNPSLNELDLSFIRQTRNLLTRPYPEFTVTCVQGVEEKVGQIAFVKNGNLGVVIQVRLFKGEWETLATDTKSPYLDTRPLQNPGVPEVRQYRLRFWNGGQCDSEWSPTQNVLIMP